MRESDVPGRRQSYDTSARAKMNDTISSKIESRNPTATIER